MSDLYPRWAREELIELATRYGQPITRVHLNAAAANYVATINTRRRPAEVCMVVRRRSGKLLIATKDTHPAGVYRLLTGGVHPGETVFSALMRETDEETGLTVQPQRFLGVVRYQAPDDAWPQEFATFAFLLDEISGELQVRDPNERLSDFREIAPNELAEIAARLECLPAQPNVATSTTQSWGHFRAAIHRTVWQALCAEQA